jgi:hypothetical protein
MSLNPVLGWLCLLPAPWLRWVVSEHLRNMINGTFPWEEDLKKRILIASAHRYIILLPLLVAHFFCSPCFVVLLFASWKNPWEWLFMLSWVVLRVVATSPARNLATSGSLWLRKQLASWLRRKSTLPLKTLMFTSPYGETVVPFGKERESAGRRKKSPVGPWTRKKNHSPIKPPSPTRKSSPLSSSIKLGDFVCPIPRVASDPSRSCFARDLSSVPIASVFGTLNRSLKLKAPEVAI